jgi:bis(5'-nucleosyl)-tetraphosphatase (symmetrical)
MINPAAGPAEARPMPIAIGDLQGCCDAFRRLLATVDAGSVPAARSAPAVPGAAAIPAPAPLWLAGDLINRGPDSLQTLRDVISLGARARPVLGNHDLHLLAVAAGAQKERRGDTLGAILRSPDANDLIDWVRSRPLAHFENGMLMVHAGLLPEWDVSKTLELAAELEARLRRPDWKTLFTDLAAAGSGPGSGSGPRVRPDRWRDDLTGPDRSRVVLDALTRLRFCSADGQMEFATKGGPASAPPGFMPWFDVPGRRTADTTVIFGHWAAMGLMLRPNLIALDSGCVWGNKLSAVLLHPDPTQRTLTQVDCPKE